VARKILSYETVLKIGEVPTPEPGAGEIRIRVKAIGLNRAEINFRAATAGPPPAFPAQLGFLGRLSVGEPIQCVCY
jgi:NADPH:quinone reductase-like Zn-dependent oxidoreductase